MDHEISFTRHLARLVRQLATQSDAFDVEIASLQLLVRASRQGAVAVGERGGRPLVNGEPLADDGDEMLDLARRLAAHSIREMRFDAGGSPSDLLLAARVLAAEPVAGDGGRALIARLQVMEARSLRAVGAVAEHGAPTSGARHARPEIVPEIRGPMTRPATDAPIGSVEQQLAAAATATRSRRSGPASEAGSGPRLDQMFDVFAASGSTRESIATLLGRLDAAHDAKEASRELDVLVKLAFECSARQRDELATEITQELMTREAAVTDTNLARQYGIAVRRLFAPLILRGVCEQLAKRRERREDFMKILTRAGDTGAEALVEALVAAPSISERRAYYDALLHVGAGIRTLIYMLGDSRWYVVRNAVELLGEMRVAEADDALTKLLAHRDDRVRSAAATALARLASPRGQAGGTATAGDTPVEPPSVRSLASALDHEDDARVQLSIVSALGQLGTAPAVEKLVEIARTERGLLARRGRPTPLRIAAVHALGQSKSSAALAALQSLLRDKEPAVRGTASWVILGRRTAAARETAKA